MIQFIGWFCVINVIVAEIGLAASIVSKNELEPGARSKVHFMVIGYLAVAAWCFK